MYLYIILMYNGILVPVRLVWGCLCVAVKRTMYQRLNVDVNMLNAIKNVLANVSSISPSSEQRYL